MDFLDTLNLVVKNIGDKANDALELTRLTGKIAADRAAAGEDLKKIGAMYYEVYAATGEAVPEVLELCQSAKAHYDAAAAAQADIDRSKAANAPAPAQDVACPVCGKVVPADANYCPVCGARISHPAEEAPQPAAEEPAEAPAEAPAEEVVAAEDPAPAEPQAEDADFAPQE